MSYNGECLGDGQTSPEERLHIYRTIRKTKPAILLECGTWYGGGSTYAIYNSVKDTGGEFHTFELEAEKHAVSHAKYKDLEPKIHCHNMDFLLYTKDLADASVDFIFFDGVSMPSWAAEMNRKIVAECTRVLKSGGTYMLHDYNDVSNLTLPTGETIDAFLKSNFIVVTYLTASTCLMHYQKK